MVLSFVVSSVASKLSGAEKINQTTSSVNNTTRVGRWMSKGEYQKMKNSGKVQMSPNGNTTYVSNHSNIDAFSSQAKTGSVYVEFDVDSSSIKPDKFLDLVHSMTV